jgi:hypothetical protein
LLIDNLLSVNVVTANGEIVTASEKENQDLFWALRGVGPAFGFAVEFTFRAFEQGNVWAGMLAFTPDKLQGVIEFTNHFVDANNSDASFCFGFSKPPFAPGPLIVALAFFNGSTVSAEEFFGELLSLGPVMNTAAEMPFAEASAIMNAATGHGGRKVIAGAALAAPFKPDFFQDMLNDFLAFLEKVPLAGETLILVELHNYGKICAVDKSSTAFAHRGEYYNAFACPKWYDTTLDEECGSFAKKMQGKISEELKKSGKIGPEAVGMYSGFAGAGKYHSR